LYTIFIVREKLMRYFDFQDFMIGINGKDNSGHFIRRIKTIKPIALLLSVPAFNGMLYLLK
jgi:hypothetical protein